MNLIEKNKDAVISLCKTHKVAKLFVFGSVLRDDFSEKSDVDLIVYFDKIEFGNYVDNYFSFHSSLEKILKHPVDLLEGKAIINPYFKQTVDATKQLVYG